MFEGEEMKDEALKLALEALESCGAGHITDGGNQWHDEKLVDKAITAIKQARSAPVQEPVAGQPLPCPFCGHIGLDFGDGETYRWGIASCGGCGASCTDVRREYPDQGQWHTEAIAEWNKRSPAAQPATVQPSHEALMAGYKVACAFGVYESQAFNLAEKMFAAMKSAAPESEKKHD